MSVTNISEKNKFLLWGKAAGRCEYRGCNKCMYKDNLTKAEFNQAYIAHIVADSPNGPRGDINRSKSLADDLSNLMLLCDTHHRLVDKHDVDGHPESLLIEMKKEHEDRISRIVDIAPNLDSHIVIYKANVGEHTPMLTYESIREYLLPNNYPAINRSIDLGLENSPQRDKDSLFWQTEVNILEENFKNNIKPLIKNSSINHISLFAFAPMPLLIKLGTLLNDITKLEVHQPIRNPKTWNLNEEDIQTDYIMISPVNKQSKVALNISLSGTINNDRITDVLGDDVSIYTLTIQNPFNDFLQSKKQLVDFSVIIRKLFDEIKFEYGSKTTLHIFPAMPIAISIELGRYWMPKADMPLVIYDENKLNEGFFKAIEIN